MKRLFIACSALFILASCSNSGGENAAQSVTDSLDSVGKLKVESVQEAAQDAIDTIQKHTDSLKEKAETLAGQASDSLNQIKK